MIRSCCILVMLPIICTSVHAQEQELNPAHFFRLYEENGVTIAETTGGPKYQAPLFTFEEILALQEDPENEDSMLYRPGMFLRGEDGRYYVADSGASRIAVYDEKGVFLFDFGQRGFGPGDFAGLGWINFVNGELHTFDSMVTRVSRFGLDGHLINVTSSPQSVDPSGGFPYRIHLTPENLSVVMTQQEDYRPGEEWVRHCGYLYSEQGDSLLAVQSDWVKIAKMYPAGNDQLLTLRLPYSPSPKVCYSIHHGFVWGTGVTPVLDCLSFDGRRSQIRFGEEPVTITAGDRRRTREWYDGRISDLEGGRRAMLEAEKGALEWPSHRPLWRRIELDDQGFIWMEVYETIREKEEKAGMSLWRVLSPQGEYLGQVRMPLHSGIRGFSNGYLTIIRADLETGEQIPTVYRIHSTASGFTYPN